METETETETNELFSGFQIVLLSEQEDVAVIPSPDFTKKQKFRGQNNENPETGLLTKCSRHNITIWCGNPLAFCEKERLR